MTKKNKGSLPIIYLPVTLTSVTLPENLSKIGTIYFQGTKAQAQALGLPMDKTVSLGGIPLTITADGGTKVYDGTALTVDTYTVTGLADGHTLQSVTITGVQTDVGTSNNTPSNAVIVDADDNVVTDEYTITYIPGTLTVTPKPVTVSAVGLTKEYGEADPTMDSDRARRETRSSRPAIRWPMMSKASCSGLWWMFS